MSTRSLRLGMITVALLVCACRGGADTPSGGRDAVPSATSAETGPPPQSTKELVLAAPRDLAPGEKDPYYAAATLKVWESLVTVDDEWTPQPQLALSWEPAADGLSWTFHLRQDVVFSDRSPFNAGAVVANINRYLAISPRSSPFYSLNKTVAYGDLTRVEQLDPFTVRFVHGTPAPSFPAMIATYFSAIFAPASFAENGDFTGPPIATGPFRVVERRPDQYVLLEANPHYRGTPPRSARIRVRTIPDPNTRVSALRAGEIQGVLDLGAIQPAAVQALTRGGDFQESSAPIAITHYIFVNGTRAPFSDARLRQAISLAVDRRRVVDDLFNGYGLPAGSMLSSVSKQWHDPSITLPADPNRAALLAREVLGGRRQAAVVIIPSFQLDRYPYKALGEYLQAQLRPLGIDAEIRILESAAFNKVAADGEYDLALRTQGLASSDPESLFRGYLGRDGATNKGFSFGYASAEVEQALSALLRESNEARRKEQFVRLQQAAARDLPVIPLFYEKGVVIVAKEVQGYVLSTSGGVSLETAWRK